MTLTMSKVFFLAAVIILVVVFIFGAFTDEMGGRELIGVLGLGTACGFAGFLVP